MAVSARSSADVVVVGAGPAGWAMADHCARHQLDVVVVAPDPTGSWRATYGIWPGQTAALPAGAELVTAPRVQVGDGLLGRGYAVLDNRTVLAAYARCPPRRVAGAVAGAEHGQDGSTVVLRSGARIRCRLIVDASGQRQVMTGRAGQGPRVEQTAFGMVFPAAAVAPLIEPGDAVLMRWDRTTHGCPTFLYAVPLPGNAVLVEETSLARRPGLGLRELKHRLRRRLLDAGVDPETHIGTEHVRFAMDVPRTVSRDHVVPYGVAAGMMHPATGYSVGEALTTAPFVAAALAEELPRGCRRAARAADAHIWSPSARAVHRLRRWGQQTLLNLPAQRVPDFFDAFFSIPPDLQDSYLCGRDDLTGTIRAMTSCYGRATGSVRAAMTAGGFRRHMPA